MIRPLLLFFTACLLLTSTSLLAQNNPSAPLLLTGSLEDEQQNPVSFGNAAVYHQQDSSLIAGAVSNEMGKFEISLKPGNYYLKISSLSFEDQIIPNLTIREQPHDLGIIVLKSNDKFLEEVVVQGQKSQLELSLDKKVFNVGQDLANAGGNAAEVLRNVPSVAVDVEGNVSLRGSSSVRILIDGQPSGLVGTGGQGLEQLQASSIERIEVITNPSARYEAEGMGGIINIVLKKERKKGINGSFDLIAGHPTNFGAAANVNYRRKNLNFFVNYTATYRDTPGRRTLYQELYRDGNTFITEQNVSSSLTGMNNNARGGLDYFFNDNNILTAAYTYRISKGKRYTNLEYRDYLNNTNNLQSITRRTQDESETEPNSEYTLTYKRNFAREGHELSADVRYLDNWESSDQLFTEKSFNPDGSAADSREILQHSPNEETEKQLLFTLDYAHPFAEKGRLEGGLRSSSRDMNNDFTVTEENEEGHFIPIDSLTNEFLYEENIHAIYGIIGNKIQKFSYQVGLRGEYTDVTTTLKKNNEINPRNYANLFPSVHLSYDLPKDHALQISYSRRVRRPQYNDLSPFMTYSDNRNYFSGNPDLEPEFSDAFEVGHIKYMDNGSISSSVFYRHTTGKILRIRRLDEQGIATTLPENLAIENSFGAEFTASYDLYRWWRMDGSLVFFQASIDGSNLSTDLQSDTYSGQSRLSSRFTFWNGAELQLRGNYEAPQQTPQGIRKSIATLDLAASKDILKDKGTLTFTIMDVFNSRRYRTVMEGTTFYTEINSQGRLRQLNLTFNYRLHQAKKKDSGGLDEEF